MTTSGLDDFTARILLRYFRSARSTSLADPRFSHTDDVEILRYHWAVSRPVSDLCNHLVHNRHEVQSALGEIVRIDDAVVRGRIDARRTVVERALSGHRTRVVFAQPLRVYTSGPNHVLVWVLQRANILLSRFMEEAGVASGYSGLISDSSRLIGTVRRISSVAQAMHETDASQRPSPQSLTQAASSRKKLYRLAYSAYRSLQQIEDGDPETIVEMLRTTLLGPLHEWQTFELALALGMASALADKISQPVRLVPISPGSATAVIQVGKNRIFWQSRTASYSEPEPEPSETIVNCMLSAYGIAAGSDRPDIVLAGEDGAVLAVAEAKFFTNEMESWRTAFRAAAVQLVRYGRGYASGASLQDLLSRSIVALWHYPKEERLSSLPAEQAVVLDFTDLVEENLQVWSDRVAAVISF